MAKLSQDFCSSGCTSETKTAIFPMLKLPPSGQPDTSTLPLQIVNIFRMSARNIHGPPYFLISHITQDNLLRSLGKIFQLLTVSSSEFLFLKSNNRPGELLLLWDSPLTLAHCCLFFYYYYFQTMSTSFRMFFLFFRYVTLKKFMITISREYTM